MISRACVGAAILLVTASCAAADPTGSDASDIGEVPPELRHSDADSPVPTWDQLTRSGDADRLAHVIRIAGQGDPDRARSTFEGWTPTVQRGFAILLDKIDNEGWLDSVDSLDGDPWDTAFHFHPRNTSAGTFEQVLQTKAYSDGVYTENTIANGAFAYLTKWNHKDWDRGFIENDTPHGALHVGIFDDGAVEVHMELYDPMYDNGAPYADLIWAPGLGWLNWRLTSLHLYWEAGARAKYRISANYYHFLRDAGFPLSF